MQRRSFISALAALLAGTFGGGCSTQPPPPPVKTVDFPTKAGEVITVTDQVVHMRLPESGGKLQVWAPANLTWHDQQVNGTLGRAVIGRVNDDYGVPYLVRYTVGTKVYQVTIVKTRIATEYRSVHDGQHAYLYREEEGYEPGRTGWYRPLADATWRYDTELDDWA